MTFQPVEATALVELVQSLDGQIIENTLYFRSPIDYDATALELLAGTVAGWWTDQMKPLLSSALSLTSVKATALHDVTGPQFIYTTGLPATGDQSAAAMPNNVSLCVSFRSALIGRSFRGRNYVPGIVESAVTLSSVSSGTASAIVAAYETLQDVLPVGTNWVIVSRTTDHNPRETGVTVPVVSVLVVDLVVDSQRRRLPGRGT